MFLYIIKQLLFVGSIFLIVGCANISQSVADTTPEQPLSAQARLDKTFALGLESIGKRYYLDAYNVLRQGRKEAEVAKLPLPEKYVVLSKLASEGALHVLADRLRTLYYTEPWGGREMQFIQKTIEQIVEEERLPPPEVFTRLSRKMHKDRLELFFFNSPELKIPRLDS